MEPMLIRRAEPDEGPAVLAVLDDAARWLAARGVEQWPAAFRTEWIEPALGSGEVWLAERAGAAVATVTLQWSDPLWPDDGRAGYLHRFAVRRQVAGLGTELLGWAASATRERGRDRLRLDCSATNASLRAYYENAGFLFCGDVEVPTTALQWGKGRRVMVSLYELSLEP
ncbi:GNAT family N-acetyltransferase [Pseudonocardia xinjiangensis]|uniref:GNAT family N-acetyltransferase n=1 Tax=Pseudonocardia xinjiangensis TaxID=75289 RepID=UPI003D918573